MLISGVYFVIMLHSLVCITYVCFFKENNLNNILCHMKTFLKEQYLALWRSCSCREERNRLEKLYLDQTNIKDNKN